MKKLTEKNSMVLNIFFFAFVLPVFGMLNCSGFSASDMRVESCFLDGNIFRDYASFYLGWLYISSMVLYPIVFYVAGVLFLTKIVYKGSNS